MKKRFLMILAIISLNVLLVACSDDQEDNAETNTDANTKETESSETTEPVEAEEVADDEVVAVVNGEEVKGSAYNQMYNQTLMMFQQYGQDASDADLVKEQTLSAVIEQELLTQETEEKGIEVSDTEVDENLEAIKSQFETEDQFKEQLTQLNMTEQGLRDQLAYEIRLNSYIDQEVSDIEVSEEEVQEYYDQIASSQEDAPAFDELKAQIEEELVRQQRQEALGGIISDLKEQSEIEELI